VHSGWRMNNFFQRVTSAVKGQFTTVPSDDTDATETQGTTENTEQISETKDSAVVESSAAETGAAEPSTATAETDSKDEEASSPVNKMMSFLPKQLSGMFGGEKGTLKESAKLLENDIETGSSGINTSTTEQPAATEVASQGGVFSGWFGSKSTDESGNKTQEAKESAVESGGLASWLSPLSIMKTREPNLYVLVDSSCSACLLFVSLCWLMPLETAGTRFVLRYHAQIE